MRIQENRIVGPERYMAHADLDKIGISAQLEIHFQSCCAPRQGKLNFRELGLRLSTLQGVSIQFANELELQLAGQPKMRVDPNRDPRGARP